MLSHLRILVCESVNRNQPVAKQAISALDVPLILTIEQGPNLGQRVLETVVG